MPAHAAASGSAFAGFIEGVTGGFQDITELRGRRADRRRLAEGDAADRERLSRLDAIEAEDRKRRLRSDAEDRAFRLFDFSQAHPEVRFDPSLLGGGAPGTAQGTRSGLRIRPSDDDEAIQAVVGDFRGRVGEDLMREPLTERDIFAGVRVGQFNDQAGVGASSRAAGLTAPGVAGTALPADSGLPRRANVPTGDRPALPRGFTSTGLPSLAELDEQRQQKIMQGIADALGSGDNVRSFLSEHPDILDRLMEGSVLDDVLNVPGSRSPSLRTLATSTGFFNVNPLTGAAEPLLGPGGVQLTGVARSGGEDNAVGDLLGDIEEDIRLARENTLRSEDPDAAADEAAQQWGLRDEAHFLELRQERTRGILGDRDAGDGGSSKQVITQDQADFLRTDQGWTDARINEVYTVR